MLTAGNYKIYILETGRFALDAGVVFGPIPKTMWGEKIKIDQKNRMEMALRSILIVGNHRKILVETGLGDNLSAKMKSIYGVDYSHFTLTNALGEIGIGYNDITDVINTHLHFDHCGGNVVDNEEGWQPAFGQADYYIQKKQYEWAQSPSMLDRNSYIPENYENLYSNGIMKLLEGESELFPGIHILTTDGHTPGQQHILIEDKEEPVFFAADLFPLHFNIITPWFSSLELSPLNFMDEKEEILTRAADQNWRIIFSHDTEVISARVKRGSKYYRSYEQQSGT